MWVDQIDLELGHGIETQPLVYELVNDTVSPAHRLPLKL